MKLLRRRRLSLLLGLLVLAGGLVPFALLLAQATAWRPVPTGASAGSSGLRVPYTAPNGVPAVGTFGVYLEPAETPPALRLNVATNRLTVERLSVVRSVDELQAGVAASHPPSIWLNETALDLVPPDWLRAQLHRGVVIVGINTTERALKAVLGVSLDGGTPDWRHPSKPTFVVYYQADYTFVNGAGRLTSGHAAGGFNESYDPEHPDTLFGFVREATRAIQELSLTPPTPTSVSHSPP